MVGQLVGFKDVEYTKNGVENRLVELYIVRKPYSSEDSVKGNVACCKTIFGVKACASLPKLSVNDMIEVITEIIGKYENVVEVNNLTANANGKGS